MNCAVTAFKIDFNGTVGPCGSQGGCFNVGSQGAFAFTLVAFGMVQIRATKALGVVSIDKTRQGLPIAVAQDDTDGEAKCCAMKLPMQCSSQDSHDFLIVGIKAIKNRIGQGCGRVQGQIFITSNEATMSKGQAPFEEGSSHSLRQTVVVIEGIQNCRSTSVNLLAIIPRAWLGKQIAKHNGFEFAMCGLVWNMGGQGLDPRGLGARVPLGEI